MRIDKFLKVSRIIKRRTLAKGVCDAGRVQINGRPAKAGTEVAVGDRLCLIYGPRLLEVEIVEIKETMAANQAATMYRVLREERLKQEQDEL